MTLRRSFTLAVLGGLAGSLIAMQVFAGGDKVAFPENHFARGVMYVVLDRYDLKQVREYYATPAAVEAARKDQPMPSGTVLWQLVYAAKLDDKSNPLKD